jgi:hypothetical protein
MLQNNNIGAYLKKKILCHYLILLSPEGDITDSLLFSLSILTVGRFQPVTGHKDP